MPGPKRREIVQTEGTTSQSSRRESSEERLKHYRDRMAQIEAARDVTQDPSHHRLVELIPLMQEVQDLKRKIDNKEAYDHENMSANFRARYATDSALKPGGRAEATSVLRVTSDVRKRLTERKLPIDYRIGFHLQNGIIDVQRAYRDADKKADETSEIPNTTAMNVSDMMVEQSTSVALKSGFDIRQFNPTELRVSGIFETNTLRTVLSIKDAKRQNLKKGAIKEFSANDKAFYELQLTPFGKSFLYYQRTHYPNKSIARIKLERGHKSEQIERITFYLEVLMDN